MKKPHLLLVHSFPTNSVLLHGLEEYLEDYFTVHFIDLPGFHKDVHAHKGRVSLKKFSNYFDDKIKELNLDEYIVAGISFGFLVVNNAKLDNRCKAILAIEPYINAKCLNISFLNRKKYIAMSLFLSLISQFKLERKIWGKRIFHKFLQQEFKCSEDSISTIIEHIDPKTFFKVTRILMNYHKNPKFHKLPHILIGNFTDDVVNFASVVEIFVKNVDKLEVISESVDHFPKNLTKEYFAKMIPKENIFKMINYIK